MGCRCNERRQALRVVFDPNQFGKKAVVEAAKFVAKSAAEDVASLMRRRTLATRLNLQRRTR